DRSLDRHRDLPTLDQERPRPPRLVAALDRYREDGKAQPQGDGERPLLEWPQRSCPGTGAFRIDDHRPTRGDQRLGLLVELLVDGDAGLAVDFDDPDRLHRLGEERDA